ncbi:MAG: hypothetical protein L6R41_006995 [Letrouitia leprolyta]|nr:MAG: hypothetical protein L6R41_006995 [Letrouitia leprolyta]
MIGLSQVLSWRQDMYDDAFRRIQAIYFCFHPPEAFLSYIAQMKAVLTRNKISLSPLTRRAFATSSPQRLKNRIHPPIRSQSELTTLLLLTISSRTPLLTLWTASWCSSCRAIRPHILSLLENDRLGEKEGGVAYAEIEMDALDIVSSGMAGQYFVNSIPTLLSFRAGEAALESKITSVGEMKDGEFMRLWIENEARRGGDRGGGGGFGFGLGGMFGVGEK